MIVASKTYELESATEAAFFVYGKKVKKGAISQASSNVWYQVELLPR